MGKPTQPSDSDLRNLAIAEAQHLHDSTGLSATREALAHVIDCLEGRVPLDAGFAPNAKRGG